MDPTSLNLLHIEDSEDDALLLQRELQHSGLDIVAERVETPEDLRTVLPQRQWDIIISDFRMPRFSAAAALAIVQESKVDVPFIVVSGTIGETIAVDLMKAGAHDYVMKENLTRLPETIRRELREAEIRKQRRETEAALAKSEAKNRACLRAIPDLMVLIDDKGNYREVVSAPTDLEIYFDGQSPVGRSVNDFIPPELARRKLHAIQQALATGQLQVYEQQLALNGELRYEEVRVIKSGRDEVLLMIRDITDRKRTEKKLEKRERYLTVLAEVQQMLLSTKVDSALYDRILSLLQSVAGADRIYVFENHTDAAGYQVMSQRAERCATHITPQINNPDLQNLSYGEALPAWFQHEFTTKGLINSSVSQIPVADRVLLEAQDIRSILAIPMIANGEFFGFIGFDDCQMEKQWDALEVDILRSIATAIALAKEREQASQALAHLNRELEDRVVQRTAALQESEAKLQAIFDFAPSLIYVKDLEGRYMRVNRAYLELFNCKAEDIIGKTDQEFFLPQIAQLFVANDRDVLSEQGFKQFEETVRVGDRERIFLSNKFVLRDQQGEPYGICGISIDISDRKQAEAQLYQTNAELARATRLKDEFLANMSHELRTPLNAILGMAEGLREQTFGAINENQHHAIQTIESSGAHLLSLINDVLDLSKVEAGQMKLHVGPVSVIQLVRSSLAFVRQQALKKKIQIRTEIPNDVPNFMVDERRINQVLINLLNNAVKFTAPQGRITVKVEHLPTAVIARAETNLIRIAICDTGIGIAAADLPCLFQPFVQIDGALNRRQEGTGLGLSLVKRIVELHGGQVTVESEVGVGSCFRVDLPCEADPLLAGQARSTSLVTYAAASAPFNHADALVLIAEPDEANRFTLSSYLEAKGYRVLIARAASEILPLAQSANPALILISEQAAAEDLALMRNLRTISALERVPVVVLTNPARESDRDQYLSVGVNHCLEKPAKLKELISVIQRLIVSNSPGHNELR